MEKQNEGTDFLYLSPQRGFQHHAMVSDELNNLSAVIPKE
jgi:hypothetical protein